jgi:hypothetical protein
VAALPDSATTRQRGLHHGGCGLGLGQINNLNRRFNYCVTGQPDHHCILKAQGIEGGEHFMVATGLGQAFTQRLHRRIYQLSLEFGMGAEGTHDRAFWQSTELRKLGVHPSVDHHHLSAIGFRQA